jgi:hypothetical protein
MSRRPAPLAVVISAARSQAVDAPVVAQSAVWLGQGECRRVPRALGNVPISLRFQAGES